MKKLILVALLIIIPYSSFAEDAKKSFAVLGNYNMYNFRSQYFKIAAQGEYSYQWDWFALVNTVNMGMGKEPIISGGYAAPFTISYTLGLRFFFGKYVFADILNPTVGTQVAMMSKETLQAPNKMELFIGSSWGLGFLAPITKNLELQAEIKFDFMLGGYYQGVSRNLGYLIGVKWNL